MKQPREKKEKKEEKPKFYELAAETIEDVEKVMGNMSIPFKIKTKYVGVSRQNTLIKLKKASPEVQYTTNIDMFVFMNEDFLDNLDEEAIKILMHQELDKLNFDIAKGTFKLGKFRLQTNEGILNKYGIDAVARANQLSELYHKQAKDNDGTTKFDPNSADVQAKLKANKKAGVEFN